MFYKTNAVIDTLVDMIKQSLKYTRNLNLRTIPDHSYSHGRLCEVSIDEADGLKIKEAFMHDIENVTATLCTLSDFDATMTCLMVKTFARTVIRVLTVGEVREASFVQAGRLG